MNIENLTILRDHLKTLPEQENVEVGFNMGDWYQGTGNAKCYPPDHSGHNCGTVACIAGHTVALFYPGGLKKFLAYTGRTYKKNAASYLGLTYDEAEGLFVPPYPNKFLESLTLDQTIKVLDLVIEGMEPSDAWDKVL